jgi:hypothetical protein
LRYEISQQKITSVFREIVILFREISQKNIAKFREKIEKNLRNIVNGGLDPGHAPNQIGQEKSQNIYQRKSLVVG